MMQHYNQGNIFKHILSYLAFIIMVVRLSECRPHHLIDLSYAYNNETPNFPIYIPMKRQNPRTETINNISFQVAELYGAEHAGTHVDAPYHFGFDKNQIHDIPLEIMEGPGVVLDITYKADRLKNPDAAVTVEDIMKWEKVNGRIPERSIVIMYSGWGKYAHNSTLYFGSLNPGQLKIHFPSFNKEACIFLTKFRNIRAIGVDTASIDLGNSTDYPCHIIFANVNGIGLENVANVEKLPPKGSYIRAYPMKLEGGSGAPTRIIATVENRPLISFFSNFPLLSFIFT